VTSQLNDQLLDRVLDSWMDEGPIAVSEVVIDAALARVPTTRQRGRPFQFGPWRVARMQALAVPSFVVLALAVVAVLTLLRLSPTVGPDPLQTPSAPAPTPPAATPQPTPTQAPTSATGRARVEVTGATDLTDTWGFVPNADVQEFPGLTLYAFYELASTACGCPGGRYLEVHLDPEAAAEYPLGQPVVTGERLILRFGFPPDVYISGEYMNGHLSRAGECAVSFTRFTSTEVEATFECADVPSDVNAQLIGVVGSFSFDPREVIALPTPSESAAAQPDDIS
jgi:hypothetical protein